MMRATLDERMKEALYYIPNDEHYDATYEICAVAAGECNNELFVENNNTVNRILELKNTNPELAEKLFALGDEASKMRKAKKISLKSVALRPSLFARLLRSLAILLMSPYVLATIAFVLPKKLLCNAVFKKFKDQAFRNSVRLIVNLVIWPLLMIIYSAIAYACLPWQWALPLTLALLPAPYVLHDIYKTSRMLKSNFKLYRYKALRAKYNEIKELLFSKES